MSVTFRIGELGERAGVTLRTIRYYESIGLLPTTSREVSAQRFYTEQAVIRLKKIEQLKALGLSLEEIAAVLDLYFSDPSGCAKRAKLAVLGILRQHFAEARRQIDALEGFCMEVQAHIDDYENSLACFENKNRKK